MPFTAINIRAILYVIGNLLLGLAGFMLLPAALGMALDEAGASGFWIAALITSAFGGACVLGYRQNEAIALNRREGFLLTTLAYLIVTGFSTLPLMLSEFHLSFTDAFFEVMSGLTTTGSTVLAGLDHAPRSLLLWRALLQGIGGIGIIVLAVAVLPLLRVGGMQLFRTESSDKSEKIRPRVSDVAKGLANLYIFLVIACAAAYWLAGMSPFDAVTHAMPTISTGGFANYDTSLGYFANPAIPWIASFFMLLGGTTFILLLRAGSGDFRALFGDEQFQLYIIILLFAALSLTLWQMVVSNRDAAEALRVSVFSVITVATTTGFAVEDYTKWGSFPIMMFFFLLFVGGCTGSTAGGIKIFRLNILGNVIRWQIRQLVHPHRVTSPVYNGQAIGDDVIRSVMGFLIFYASGVVILSLGLALCGLDFETSLSGVAQAIGNVGPGLGSIIGPAGNFASLPDPAKWILSLAMLLGRLELLTVLVLLSPVYWRG